MRKQETLPRRLPAEAGFKTRTGLALADLADVLDGNAHCIYYSLRLITTRRVINNKPPPDLPFLLSRDG